MFLHKIELENLLSFKHVELNLKPLNVLIGANAAGKSNLIRSLSLARLLPERDGFIRAIADGGGTQGWIGRRSREFSRIALKGGDAFEYELTVHESANSARIASESLAGAMLRRDTDITLIQHKVMRLSISPTVSGLAEFRNPGEPAIAWFAESLGSVRLYREFQTGPGTSARHGIAASVSNRYLAEDGSNLARVLERMRRQRNYHRFNEIVNRFFESFTQIDAATENGITQVYVRERGLSTDLTAVSLSDGTLRLLCLLTVLLDEAPPPLVCIEEPEAGLHPDAIRMIAELLVDAAARTQLIVTTHSPTLIDALSDQVDSVVVVERDFDNFTTFRRLEQGLLEEWLDDYRLGELWQKGEIGGNRW